jgi:hypothetical protein
MGRWAQARKRGRDRQETVLALPPLNSVDWEGYYENVPAVFGTFTGAAPPGATHFRLRTRLELSAWTVGQDAYPLGSEASCACDEVQSPQDLLQAEARFETAAGLFGDWGTTKDIAHE